MPRCSPTTISHCSNGLAESLAAAIHNARTSGEGSEKLEPGTRNLEPESVFRREGKYWTVEFAGTVARLKDAKGLHYIAHLLRHPGQEFHARDLGALGAEPRPATVGASDVTHLDMGDAGVVLDTQAKTAYRGRLEELHAEFEEAERFNDPGRSARAREEIELITDQLSAAVGLGGRDRKAASDAERARLAVTKRIRAALERIRQASPALAQHLTGAITTGYFCSYTPKADTKSSWLL